MRYQEVFPNRPRLLTRKQAAQYLCISVRHLANITASGVLRPIILGGCVRYAIDDLDAYIASCRDERKAG